MRYIDAAGVAELGPAAAVEAIRTALREGLDPAADPARTSVALANGEFLLMPSEWGAAAGVKVVTVAPNNPGHGLPRVQAAYLLFDAGTLSLRAILDGAALTTLRTPAVSVAAVLDHLPNRALRLAVVGAGPQAVAHVGTLSAVRPIEAVRYVVRDPSRAPEGALELGSTAATGALRSADVVVCATSARDPVFDSEVLGDDAVVMAVGSHEPGARELDAALFGRATVIVEDVATALREAGDVIQGIAAGTLQAADLVTMREVVTGAVTLPTDRPIVFKSVGMAWQDLVIATAVTQHADL